MDRAVRNWSMTLGKQLLEEDFSLFILSLKDIAVLLSREFKNEFPSCNQRLYQLHHDLGLSSLYDYRNNFLSKYPV